MPKAMSRLWVLIVLTAFVTVAVLQAQQTTDAPPPPPSANPAPAQQGVNVQARGPVHEAFAAPAAQPEPTILVPKKPPEPINEMPPDQKPDGDMVWIGGYWAWDDDKKDFLWVSGIWRAIPPGKQWVPGYWRQQGDQWQWVPGFWQQAAQAVAPQAEQQVTYLPAPPAPPQVAAAGAPPTSDSFYVPGYWTWTGTTYGWRAGYWARVQPGYVWVPAHYRWTPGGYVFIPGYWDYALDTRGVLYAPVEVDAVVLGPAFVYQPVYVVPSAVVVDAFFIRPAYCHYYFGDYYGVSYRSWGFESCVVYSRRCYDPVFSYACWEHRSDPAWVSVQINLTSARYEGRAPVPPRTVNITNVTNVTNVTNINNYNRTTVNNGIVPFRQYAAARNINTVRLNPTQVAAARQQSVAMQRTAVVRARSEFTPGGGRITQPRTASIATPSLRPVGPPATSRALNPATRVGGYGAQNGVRPNTYNPAAGRPPSPGMGNRPGYPGTGAYPGRPGAYPNNGRGPLPNGGRSMQPQLQSRRAPPRPAYPSRPQPAERERPNPRGDR